MNGVGETIIIGSWEAVSLVESKHVDMGKVFQCKLKKVTGISWKSVSVLGRVRVTLIIKDKVQLSYDAFVVKELKFGCTLGADQLGDGKSVIDFESGTLRFHGAVITRQLELVCVGIGVGIEEVTELGAQLVEKKRETFLSCCGESLSQDEKEKVIQMLMRNEEVFSWNGDNVKVRSPLCKLEIIPGSKPVASKSYRYSDLEFRALETQLENG